MKIPAQHNGCPIGEERAIRRLRATIPEVVAAAAVQDRSGLKNVGAAKGPSTVKLETVRKSTGTLHHPRVSSNPCRSKCSRLRQESLTC